MRRRRDRWARVAWVIVVLAGGCLVPRRPEPPPPPPIAMEDAIGIVNRNIAAAEGALRAVGWVNGSFVDSEGRKRCYNVDAVLFYLPPHYVRFDLKSFGTRRFLFGSNASRYWFYDQEQDAYQCGVHGAEDELSAEMPIKPRRLIDALGLSFVSESAGSAAEDAGTVRLVQRVVDEYQQVLFLKYDEGGRLVIEKEYWLDRRPPRLVRRVVIRNADGVVELESTLDDYRAASPGGPLVPTVMTAVWPGSEARMRFRVGKWGVFDQVGPDGPQFMTPEACN